MYYVPTIKDLEGRKISGVLGFEPGSEEIIFHTDWGPLVMGHQQDCCEYVSVEEVHGDAYDIIGSTVVSAEESVTSGDSQYGSENQTGTTPRESISGSTRQEAAVNNGPCVDPRLAIEPSCSSGTTKKP